MSSQRITVWMPTLTKYLTHHIGWDMVISPYVTIVSDSGSRNVEIPAVRLIRHGDGRREIIDGFTVTLDFYQTATVNAEVWQIVGDQLMLGMLLPRQTVEQMMIDDRVFLDANPSGWPTDPHNRNLWRFPSTGRYMGRHGWPDSITDAEMEEWDAIQAATLADVQARAWEPLNGDPEVAGPFRTVGDPDDPF